jgi:GntR family transcriptional regulator, negative regulator for fad regulon and positive regulator of fabA
MNTSWAPPLKPGEISESRLIRAILDGTFPINSKLPAERDLAVLLGVTRPTLRETMQRLARDGWLDIQHGKPTRVRDFWKEGGLGVSIALAQYQSPLPKDFVQNLLSVRILLAPTYTQLAVANAPDELIDFLETSNDLADTADAYADYDWRLHWTLTIHSGNTFFTHFVNSVKRLYEIMGIPYFSFAQTREHSRGFYLQLLQHTREHNDGAAGELAEKIMTESCQLWIELAAPRLKTNIKEE